MLLDHGGVSGRTASTVQEGSEPEGFWTALGGMGEYPKVKEVEEVSQPPRLFQVRGCVPPGVLPFLFRDVVRIFPFFLFLIFAPPGGSMRKAEKFNVIFLGTCRRARQSPRYSMV